jgi:ABC-type lipoprotein release transport system permease subunit
VRDDETMSDALWILGCCIAIGVSAVILFLFVMYA